MVFVAGTRDGCAVVTSGSSGAESFAGRSVMDFSQQTLWRRTRSRYTADASSRRSQCGISPLGYLILSLGPVPGQGKRITHSNRFQNPSHRKPADHRAHEREECLVDVSPLVIPHAKAAKLVEPRKRPLHDPPPPCRMRKLVTPLSSTRGQHRRADHDAQYEHHRVPTTMQPSASPQVAAATVLDAAGGGYSDRRTPQGFARGAAG